MNLLFCSVGRRGELVKNFKNSLKEKVTVIATDNSPYAPALYLADKHYLVPLVRDENYIDVILDICRKEKIDAITTFIDPEIEILAKNRKLFEELGIIVLAPYEQTAKLCFDKYEMYKFLVANNINTVKTFGNYDEFLKDYHKNNISFPVFVKPRTGSGSVGAQKVFCCTELHELCEKNPTLIIQEYMDGQDLDADVYVDTISHKPVSIFTKRKLETKIGGASKTISFKDETLFEFVKEIVSKFDFNGPIDIDFFYKNGKYYMSEINPRFGGAYLHAFGAGVDFVKMIYNNVNHVANDTRIGDYDEGVVMMMYDSVVITKEEDMINM